MAVINMKQENFLQLLYSIINVPLYYVNKENKSVILNPYFIPKKLDEIIKSNRKQIINALKINQVIRLKDYSKLTYIGFVTKDSKVIIGPFLDQEMNNSDLAQLKKRLRLIGEEEIMIDNMYNQLKILEPIQINLIHNIISHLLDMSFDEIKDELLIPVDALYSEKNQHWVYLKSGSSFKKTNVGIGASNSDFVIIKEGIKEGDQLALSDPFPENESKNKQDEL